MAPISAGAEKMNVFLQQRRKKLNQNKGFRKQRILKHYHKAKQTYDKQLQSRFGVKQQEGQNNQKNQLNPQVQRKINFYNEVFNEPHVNQRISGNKKKKNKKNKNGQQWREQVQQKNEKQVVQQKLDKLKQKKVKFIRKMKVQKTARGQPVMRNMIKYALTKIEQNINKQKMQKIVKQQNDKNLLNKNKNQQNRHQQNKGNNLNNRRYEK